MLRWAGVVWLVIMSWTESADVDLPSRDLRCAYVEQCGSDKPEYCRLSMSIVAGALIISSG